MKQVLTILKTAESNRNPGINVSIAHLVTFDDEGDGEAKYQIIYGENATQNFDTFLDANTVFKHFTKPKREYSLV